MCGVSMTNKHGNGHTKTMFGKRWRRVVVESDDDDDGAAGGQQNPPPSMHASHSSEPWKCAACTYENCPRRSVCEVCRVRRAVEDIKRRRRVVEEINLFEDDEDDYIRLVPQSLFPRVRQSLCYADAKALRAAGRTVGKIANGWCARWDEELRNHWWLKHLVCNACGKTFETPSRLFSHQGFSCNPPLYL